MTYIAKTENKFSIGHIEQNTKRVVVTWYSQTNGSVKPRLPRPTNPLNGLGGVKAYLGGSTSLDAMGCKEGLLVQSRLK
jgi:hypothetical protein